MICYPEIFSMFDLAGVASNSQMTQEQSDALLKTYLGKKPDAPLKQSFAAMHCASLLRETLWAMTSEIFLNAPGVDYAAYVTDNLDLYRKSIDHYQSVYGLL
jgi:thiamine kinase-like enzyme